MRRITSTHLPRLAYTTRVSHSDPKAGRVAEVPAHRRPLIPVVTQLDLGPWLQQKPRRGGNVVEAGALCFFTHPFPKSIPCSGPAAAAQQLGPVG